MVAITIQVAPTADPGALDAAARALKRQAEILESGGDAGTFARQASGSPWKGQAADRFRHTVTQDANQAKLLAGELKSIAALIEAGANKIRAYRARMAALQKEMNQLQQKDGAIQQQENAILQKARSLSP